MSWGRDKSSQNIDNLVVRVVGYFSVLKNFGIWSCIHLYSERGNNAIDNIDWRFGWTKHNGPKFKLKQLWYYILNSSRLHMIKHLIMTKLKWSREKWNFVFHNSISKYRIPLWVIRMLIGKKWRLKLFRLSFPAWEITLYEELPKYPVWGAMKLLHMQAYMGTAKLRNDPV